MEYAEERNEVSQRAGFRTEIEGKNSNLLKTYNTTRKNKQNL